MGTFAVTSLDGDLFVRYYGEGKFVLSSQSVAPEDAMITTTSIDALGVFILEVMELIDTETPEWG
jgi:hypothetical protein